MRFSVYRPPAAQSGSVPVLYYLAGLTCTEETFAIKAGAQRVAAELGLMLVAPDTSPRVPRLPGDDSAWDFGLGAGFYVDATVEPWSRHYRMYSYVTRELPQIVAASFPARAGAQGIFGHSMGGHGALVCALRNPGSYQSLSAFAPIAAPSRCPWGTKAFSGYLGDDRKAWAEYDASELIARSSAWRRARGAPASRHHVGNSRRAVRAHSAPGHAPRCRDSLAVRAAGADRGLRYRRQCHRRRPPPTIAPALRDAAPRCAHGPPQAPGHHQQVEVPCQSTATRIPASTHQIAAADTLISYPIAPACTPSRDSGRTSDSRHTARPRQRQR